MSSSEDDDAAFDAFLASMKPVKKEKYRISAGSLDDFIVDDSLLSFEEASFSEIEEKKHDKREKDFHASYIDETDEDILLPVTDNIREMEKKSPSNRVDNEVMNEIDKSDEKFDNRDYAAVRDQGKKTKVNNQKRKEKVSLNLSKESLSRKLIFSNTNGKSREKFTPKRSTACSSVSRKSAFSTPRIIFSSDSDSDEDTDGGISNQIDSIGIQDDYNEKTDPTSSMPSYESDKIENLDSDIVKKNIHHYDGSIENLCSDFDQVSLDRQKSNKASTLTSKSQNLTSPLIATRKKSKILIFSDDSESDDDVIYVESDSDKENSAQKSSNRDMSSFDVDDDSVFLTPSLIRKKTPSRSTHTPLLNTKPRKNISNHGLPSYEANRSTDSVFLTPTPFQKKTPLKPSTGHLENASVPYFKNSSCTQKRDGLPPNLPRNCDSGVGFKRNRDVLTKALYEYFNKTVFEGDLPKDMIVEWDKRLLKTAGVTKCSTRKTMTTEDGITCVKTVYSAKISLSEKVLDSLHRLRDTLCHEMCHAAVWLIDKQNDGHGPFWRGWARKAVAAHPEMPVVRRCHSYDISYKFQYQCTVCRKIYGRHSKSIKVDKQVCGVCKGHLVFLPVKNVDGTPVKARTPNKFAMFVKENYKITQKSNSIGGVTPKHSDVMKALSRQFASLSAKK